jgi:flagellar capping protein FliD
MRRYCRSLPEDHRRRYGAVEALKIGYGGVAYVSRVLGMSRSTIYSGIEEIRRWESEDGDTPRRPSGESGRVRRAGGGRRSVLERVALDVAVNEVLETHTAGSPTDERVQWTDLTPTRLVHQLLERGVEVSRFIAAGLLKRAGLRQRTLRKELITGEVDSVERDTQFRRIAAVRRLAARQGVPVLSIDTKKKEPVGSLHRPGSAYCSAAQSVYDHDFPHLSRGRLVPHGVYDLRFNDAFITLGTSHETGAFVCDAIALAWSEMFSERYPNARKLVLLCDNGGANAARSLLFKEEAGENKYISVSMSWRSDDYNAVAAGPAPFTIELVNVTETSQGATLISESLTEDTSGYDASYDNINDVLALPEAKIGLITADAPVDAYLHIAAGERSKSDYDTFKLQFDESSDYRIVVTPEDPSVFQGSKTIYLWKEDGSYDELIMNSPDFVGGALYSDVFSAEAGENKYISVSMSWRSDDYSAVAAGPAPFTIELVNVTETSQGATLISESLTEDTSGYDASYDNINDVLALPEAKIGLITADAPVDAYLHIAAGERSKSDYDTFKLQFDESSDYRIVVTPEDPSVFQGSKTIYLWKEDGSYDELIMNSPDFVGGALYSDVFSAEAGENKYISVSMSWRSDDYSAVAAGPAPFTIELVNVTETSQGATLISESLTEDTSGYDASYDNINDVLALPEAKIGLITADAPVDAYLHIAAGERSKSDYDTFKLQFDESSDYRIAVTPEDPSVFQGSKTIYLWKEDGSYDELIMNSPDFVGGALYSDVFSAEAGRDIARKHLTVLPTSSRTDDRPLTVLRHHHPWLRLQIELL